MVVPGSHRVPRVRWYLGIFPIPHVTPLAYRTITCCGGPFQVLQLDARAKRLPNTGLQEDPATPRWQRVSAMTPPRFRLLPVRSPLLGQSRLISLPRVLRCFTSPRVAARTYALGAGSPPITAGGLPHSEISGSTPACGSPKLIAACHVLHRRSKPRHPPSALSSLTTENFSARQCSCQRAELTVQHLASSRCGG